MTRYDAFISYSTADNSAHANFIKQVRELLMGKIAALIRIRENRIENVEEKLQFFIDYRGLPANGEIDAELDERVRSSDFLFIFVGDGYLNSTYCQKEREWFRQAFDQNDSTVNERTFLFFLTADAQLSATTGSLFQLRSKSKIRWIPLFDKDTRRPLNRFLNRDGKAVENPELDNVLDDVAETYVDRCWKVAQAGEGRSALMNEIRRVLRAINPPPPPGPDGTNPHGQFRIAVGAVTKDLKEFRDQVVQILKSTPQLTVDVVDYGELVDAPEETGRTIATADVLLQIFDYGPVRAERDDPPGGHLEVQRRKVTAGRRILWCMPPEGQRSETAQESNPDHKRIIDGHRREAVSGNPAVIVEEVMRALAGNGQPGVQVMVECAEIDAVEVRKARRLVEEVWQTVMGRGVQLRPLMADWDNLRTNPNYLDQFHGIVVVDRSKQLDALFAQINKIEQDLRNRNAEVPQQLFVLPPQERAKLYNWPSVIFREVSDQLELSTDEREELRKFLEQVRDRAVPPSQPEVH